MTPTFDQWLLLPEKERETIASRWSGYTGSGEELVTKIVSDFRAKYGSLPGVEVKAQPGIHHGGTWVIDVTHPFVFDRRTLPSSHLGVFVHRTMNPHQMPVEFRNGGATPARWEAFVDSHADDIRTQLQRPEMSRSEMLSALVGMDFDEYAKFHRSRSP